MILVTSAAGRTGQAVIRKLAARGQPVRAVVRRAEQVEALRALGAQETVVGDIRSRAVMEQASRGVRAVYYICPPMVPDELDMARTAMLAARAAKVEHFVYHSVLHPYIQALPHHQQKLRVEERLLEFGMAYTILRPASYMQNVLAYWDEIVERRRYAVPYSVEARLSLVDLEDVAEAAAIVLTQPGHNAAGYDLAGPQALSARDIAAILSQQLGWPVQAERMSLETWQARAQGAEMGSYRMEALLSTYRTYDRYGLPGNPNVLGWLLGRPPTSFVQFIGRTAEELKLRMSRSRPASG